MRLAVVSPFVDRRHGTERALCELIERLAKQHGCEIHLYSQNVNDLALSDSEQSPTRSGGGIVWHRVPVIPGPHLVKFVGWMIFNEILRWWHSSFRNASFDLVLSPGINCFHADVILVHALFRRLSELSSGNLTKDAAGLSSLRAMHRKMYYKLLTILERRAYTNREVSLVAVSERTSQLLEKYFRRSDAVVAPNGVDTNTFSPAARIASRAEARARRNFHDSDFVLLLIGNDWRVKGLASVLEAIAALPQLNLHLVVVGEDEAGPFRETAEHLGFAHRCHWERPRTDVIDLYAASDVYVSPTLEDSFGLPVAEAMACGLPAITSVFAGVAGLIQDGVDGFVLRNALNVAALAELLMHLHGDSELRRRIGAAAAKKSQSWTWDRNADTIYGLLNRRHLE